MSIITKLKLSITPSAKALQASDSEGAFTKQALHSADDRAAVNAYLRDHSTPFLRLFWQLSVCTGWRTNDVAALAWDSVNLETGEVTILVAKQSKAAASRAARAVVVAHIAEARELAAMAGDIPRWQALGKLSPGDYLDTLPKDERDALIARLSAAAADAKPKIDRKTIPASLLAALREWRHGNPFDYVFARQLMPGNRARGIREGENEHASRQFFWRALRDVFQEALAIVPEIRKVVRAGRELLVRVMRLSAYSSRKTSLSLIASAAGGLDLQRAADFVGHSSTDITAKYVMPGLKLAVPEAELWA